MNYTETYRFIYSKIKNDTISHEKAHNIISHETAHRTISHEVAHNIAIRITEAISDLKLFSSGVNIEKFINELAELLEY